MNDRCVQAAYHVCGLLGVALMATGLFAAQSDVLWAVGLAAGIWSMVVLSTWGNAPWERRVK